MSTKRVAESIDMNLWIPATVEASVELTRAILRVFRDEGARKDRQKASTPAPPRARLPRRAPLSRAARTHRAPTDAQARLMWLIEEYGPVEEVNGHLRCSEAYRTKIVDEMKSYGVTFEVDVAQPKATAPFERRSLLGVHPQPNVRVPNLLKRVLRRPAVRPKDLLPQICSPRSAPPRSAAPQRSAPPPLPSPLPRPAAAPHDTLVRAFPSAAKPPAHSPRAAGAA